MRPTADEAQIDDLDPNRPPSDVGDDEVLLPTPAPITPSDPESEAEPIPVPVSSPMGRAILILLILLFAIGGIYGQHRVTRFRD